MKITKLLSLLLLCFVFLSNGCNEDDDNENLTVEENCDAPRCYVTKTRQVIDNYDEFITNWSYKTINGNKLLDKMTGESFILEFLYDNEGRNTEMKEFEVEDGQTILKYTTKIYYNNNGRVDSVIQSNAEETTPREKSTFQYDSEEKIKEIKTFSGGVYSGKSIFPEYNSAGQNTLRYTYDNEDNLINTFTSQYDCNMPSSIKYVSDNLQETIGNNFFLPCTLNSCFLERTTFDGNEEVEVYVHEYGEQGLLESRSLQRIDGEVEFTTYYDYQCD